MRLKLYAKKTLPFFVLLFLLITLSCTHNLEIINLDTYKNKDLNRLDRNVTIGIIPNTNNPYANKLLKGIARQLRKYSADVCFPYSVENSIPIDVKAIIDIRLEEEGSGRNFWINWPGFLIFTPAWHGYNYRNKYNIDVLLSRAADNQKIDSFSIPVDLEIRHADKNRTWTEIGWLEIGLIPFISGFVFIGYDDDVSNLVAKRIQTPIGGYIAQKIVSRINNFGDLGPIVKEKINTQSTKAATEIIDTDTGSVPYELLGEKYLYMEIIEKYGSPQTLSGTTNWRWVAYFPKGNFTIIVDTRTNTINDVLSGRKPQ